MGPESTKDVLRTFVTQESIRFEVWMKVRLSDGRTPQRVVWSVFTIPKCPVVSVPRVHSLSSSK